MSNEQLIADRLAEIVVEVVDDGFSLDDAEARAGSLWSLGLTSAGFIRLLSAAEDEFGFEWDLDDSADAVSSFDNLLGCVVQRATRTPAPTGGR